MTHKIAIAGLGYVGLPLASLFVTKYPVVELDISEKRIKEINAGWDSTHQLSSELLQSVLLTQNPLYSSGQFNANQSPLIDSRAENLGGLFCTSSAADIQDANTYIITVPTPVNNQNRPNLKPLSEASLTVGALLQVQLFSTVAHDEFLELNPNPYQKENTVVYNVKGVLQNSDNTL